MNLMLIAGARPNFMKIAPLTWELKRRSDVQFSLVHTGQHYDRKMSDLFFEQLAIPHPDFNLGVGGGSHAVQTAEIMRRFEPVVSEKKPDAVVVVGDVNSTVACALTAVKMGIPVAHVEAGLRSFDRTMPEEINRVVTDAISEWLLVSEPDGVKNLQHEGIPDRRIHFVGNVMIDTLLAMRDIAEKSTVLEDLQLSPRAYCTVTLHRPANVDEPRVLSGLMRALAHVGRTTPVVFPVHPRTRSAIEKLPEVDLKNIRLIEPLGYLEFMKLVAHSRMVLTDSGGLQEETTILGVPCLTLRLNTERPVTISEGTNKLVGLDPEKIIAESELVLAAPSTQRKSPPLWDGKAAKRVVDVLTHSRPV